MAGGRSRLSAYLEELQLKGQDTGPKVWFYLGVPDTRI